MVLSDAEAVFEVYNVIFVSDIYGTEEFPTY